VSTRTAVMFNVLALLALAVGVHGLSQAPMEVRSLVMPWPVLRALLVFAAVANIGSIAVLLVRAGRHRT
jgi:hypothetical protein